MVQVQLDLVRSDMVKDLLTPSVMLQAVVFSF